MRGQLKLSRGCVVIGCDNKHSAKGFCNIHYQRLIRGVPLEGNERKSVEERIMGKVSKEANGCWFWTGAKSGGDGREQYKYGYININGNARRVHRVLYSILKSEIPDGLHLLHKCDTPICVNPDHMFIGTAKDNVDDMIQKGRSAHPCGELNHSKLKASDVIKIRKMYSSGEHSYKNLSGTFHVAPSTIGNIVNRKKWKHI